MSGRPIVEFKSVRKIGESYYLLLPKEWFESHGIELPSADKKVELLVVADRDMRIVNPEHVNEVYKEVTKVTRGAKV